MPALPVTVLSGFLGAGKSTLVNHLLRHAGGRRIAVLVNDLAEVNIDAKLLKSGHTRLGTNGARLSADGLVELHNGCICCTLREEFAQEVARIAQLGRFDALVVEATGVAEPLPIALAFDEEEVGGHQLSEFAGVDSMVTVVDAYNFLRDWERGDPLLQVGLAVDAQDSRTVADLLAEQVEFANQIVVNKADLVSPADLDRLTQLLACLNPEARIVVTMFGHVSVDDLLDTRLYEREGELMDSDPPEGESERTPGEAGMPEGGTSEQPAREQVVSGRSQALAAEDRDDLQAEKAAIEAEEALFGTHRSSRTRTHAQLDIKSFVYRARRPFHPGRLWAYLAEAWPGVLRSKGLFWLATRMNESGLWSQAGKACSHQSAGRWWSSVPRELWPEDDTLRASILAEFRGPFGDRRQEIVVIGQNLDELAVRARLDACLIDPLEMRLGPLGWAQLPDPFPVWESETNDDGELTAPVLRRETPTA
jgi:G3E family GTPase